MKAGFKMLFSRDIGIDLGTSNTRVADKKGHIIINEPSVVAVDVKSKRVLATGNEAKNMIGRTPGSIVAVRPMRAGVIADFDMTADMLHDFMDRSTSRNVFTKTRVVVSVPSDVTEVERRAVEDAVRSAGAQEVELIEQSMAAALGAGLPVYEATGSMIIDIGGGTTDIAVLSLGGIACCNSIKVGGEAMDDSIVTYMRKTHNLLIGERTAEDIKLKIGSALEYDGEAAMEVRGRNLADGLPGSVEITSSDIREVLQEPVGQILTAVKETLEVTLPELSADIIDRGIYLTGGASRLRGLRDLIENEIKIPIIVPENSTDCVALGTSIKLRRAK
ncbi:rod shape-determining protein [Eubacterium coprostanoligenes]|uniref:Cell shape-determining protein MreB n=2 Tax=Eubacterium coprostanoligenes TaxID=290054 RepID=A0A1T4K3P2_9FIRM|nr:rod shape-determining protein [Eubacterium coprostanoligenes]MCI6253688.1 rod shape-determining protein [Eubacterium coprostanoligenes]MDY5400567.1 rod shape-determining protein [Eubacterium coprostanoligenes]SJZ37029.1 rod shape-determining protein MreB [Eubacterium coprostanoligenes]